MVTFKTIETTLEGEAAVQEAQTAIVTMQCFAGLRTNH
jgi:hypothetical protein